MTIHYIASNPLVVKRLAVLLEKEGVTLQRLHDAAQAWEHADWQSVEAVLLFTPFLYKGQYISAEKVWAHYLRNHHPGVRFFTAGYAKAPAGVVNHLDLLDLPAGLSAFFRQTHSAAAAPVVDGGGLKLHDKLARFFDGHGKESIFDVLSDLTRLLGMANTAASRHGDSFEAVKALFLNKAPARWTELKNRWNNYYALLLCLPVADVLRETAALIAEADRQYMAQICTDERLFQQQALLNLLQNIHKLLLKVRQSCL